MRNAGADVQEPDIDPTGPMGWLDMLALPHGNGPAWKQTDGTCSRIASARDQSAIVMNTLFGSRM